MLATAFGFFAGGVTGFALLFLSFVMVNATPSSRAAGQVVIGAAAFGALLAVVRQIRLGWAQGVPLTRAWSGGLAGLRRAWVASLAWGRGKSSWIRPARHTRSSQQDAMAFESLGLTPYSPESTYTTESAVQITGPVRVDAQLADVA